MARSRILPTKCRLCAKDRVFRTRPRPHNIDHLKELITTEMNVLDGNRAYLQRTCKTVEKLCKKCIEANGSHFEHIIKHFFNKNFVNVEIFFSIVQIGSLTFGQPCSCESTKKSAGLQLNKLKLSAENILLMLFFLKYEQI